MGVILVCNPRTFEPAWATYQDPVSKKKKKKRKETYAPEFLAWLFIYKSQYGKIGKEEETFCSNQQSWILKRK
jgi:hypothetical protein